MTDGNTTNGAIPQDFGAAVVRTATPYITAYIVTKGAEYGLDLDSTEIATSIITLGGSAWYVLVRVLEQRWPKAGWLLGSPKQPTYTES